MKKKNSGFTLIEVVVVLAVVAILAAILTPNIVKSINDSKIARATNEAQVIAASMGTFYKDLGRWPTKQNTADTGNHYYMLYGSGNTMSTGGNSSRWAKDGSTWAANKDDFNNHLSRNTPGGAITSINQYPITGQFKWNGPYITKVEADPWGTHYSCNVISFWYNDTYKNYAIYVLSAGEDMAANTLYNQSISDPANEPELTGDDIGFRMK